MTVTPDLLQTTYTKYRPTYEGLKEDYFAALYLSKKHGKDIDDLMPCCVFGNNDYGIDGYFIDREARNLYLYQFKWSTSHDLFKDSYKRLIHSGMERIFGNPLQDSQLNPTIRRLKMELDEYTSLIDKVYIRFVFNGDPEKAEQSRTLENLREDLESKKYLIDSFFEGRNVQFAIEYLSNQSNNTVQVVRTKKTHAYDICFKTTDYLETASGERFHVGFIRLTDLHQMFVEMQQRLFEKNIRAGLSGDKAPNRAIKRSLKEIVIDEATDPAYFTFNHNGITLYAEKLTLNEEDQQITIIEPRVLNGAQTITTFSRFIAENQQNPALRRNTARLQEIKVLAKVITYAKPDFVTTVTICNNRQNPVDPINLRASDEIQFELQDKFREQLGIFYERQEKAFENLTDQDLEEMGITDNKEVNIKKLAQTLLALQGEIDKMSRLSEIFENDTFYKNTFKKDYLKKPAALLLLLYKAHFRITMVVREIIDKGYSKYYWASYGKNLIWSLILQGILNDPDLEDLMEDHGTSLSITANFNIYLKDLGTKKVRLILTELMQNTKYTDFLKKEKFAFLRTKVVYQDTMAIAKRKYGWERKSL